VLDRLSGPVDVSWKVGGELDDESHTLGDYLPELQGTNKESWCMKDVMAHEAVVGLIPHFM